MSTVCGGFMLVRVHMQPCVACAACPQRNTHVSSFWHVNACACHAWSTACNLTHARATHADMHKSQQNVCSCARTQHVTPPLTLCLSSSLSQAMIEGLGIALNKLTSPPPPGLPYQPPVAAMGPPGGPGGPPPPGPGDFGGVCSTCFYLPFEPASTRLKL